MGFDPGVKLELRVDSMKHHMVQYLTDHALDLPKMVEAELDNILRHPESISKALAAQIARDLESKINDEIKSAISGVWYRSDIREKLQDAVTDALRTSLIKNEEWRKECTD